MLQSRRGEKILVISSGTEPVDMVKEAVGGSFEVLHASHP